MKQCVVAEHWTVMDLQEAQGPSRPDKPQQGASSWAQRDHRALALWSYRAKILTTIKEGQPDCTEQWTGSYDCVRACSCVWARNYVRTFTGANPQTQIRSSCVNAGCVFVWFSLLSPQQFRIYTAKLIVHRYMMWALLTATAINISIIMTCLFLFVMRMCVHLTM